MAYVRGCDSVPKEDPTKALARCLRSMILVSFDLEPTSFIEHVSDKTGQTGVKGARVNSEQVKYTVLGSTRDQRA